MPTPPAPSSAEQLPPRSAAVWAALDPVIGAGTPLRVLDVDFKSAGFSTDAADYKRVNFDNVALTVRPQDQRAQGLALP